MLHHASEGEPECSNKKPLKGRARLSRFPLHEADLLTKYFSRKNDLKCSSPPSKNALPVFKISCSYFLLPWKIPEEISRRSMLFHNWRQFLPPHVHTTFPFVTVINWPENWRLIRVRVSTMFYIFADTVFLLSTAVLWLSIYEAIFCHTKTWVW